MTRVHLVMQQSSRQEKLIFDILRELGIEVSSLEATASAHPASTPLFIYNGQMRRGRAGKKVRRTPRMLRVGSTSSVATSLNGAIPEFASSARTCIAIRSLTALEMRNQACLTSLRTALREAVRVCRKIHNVTRNTSLHKAAEERKKVKTAARAA